MQTFTFEADQSIASSKLTETQIIFIWESWMTVKSSKGRSWSSGAPFTNMV